MSQTALFTAALGLQSPWEVVDVHFDQKQRHPAYGVPTTPIQADLHAWYPITLQRAGTPEQRQQWRSVVNIFLG